MKRFIPLSLTALSLLASSVFPAVALDGWLHWRGPNQNGTSAEKNLPVELSMDDSILWTSELSGMSSPVIANGRLYVMGYEGEGPDLQEVIACYDAESGERLWIHRFNDFMSDIIYTRYATSNPTIDPETGNVYMQGSQGIIAAFTPDGEQLWQHSMMEEYGRMTFPNGRTASFVIDGDLAITHHITANWGADGPARDRFYAFDKLNGDLVWASTPGGQPKDSSYSPPILAWYEGQRVVYSGTGDGAIVCFNARTGDPIWRVKLSQGGLNTGVLLHNNDKLIAIHGSENLDNSEIGRMVAVRIPEGAKPDENGQPRIYEWNDLEIWRNDLGAFTTSPVLVGDTVYQVSEVGELCSINANTGVVNWKMKIGIEQRNSSMVYANGLLYIPMLDDPGSKTDEQSASGTRGAFYVIKPGEEGAEILSHLSLEGRCFGTPAVYRGRVYVQTTRRLYAFGSEDTSFEVADKAPTVEWPPAGAATRLQVIPSEVLLLPGSRQEFRVRKLDANGFTVAEVEDVGRLDWESYIPPTARVRARMDAAFNDAGQLVAEADAEASAGAYRATLDGMHGFIRGRILPDFPYEENFESFTIDETHPEGHLNAGLEFAYPPLPWIGARFKFEVHNLDGNKVFAKTIDNKLFQRATVLIGAPSSSDYTIAADVMTDGNRRKMSEVGLVNQRYVIVLKGNAQQLEVNSNLERIRVSVPFQVQPKKWYRLKTRVDVAGDGSGVVRAKAWEKGAEEPEAWTIEVPHKTAHQRGAPGLFGFSPQEMRVYIDNISIIQN